LSAGFRNRIFFLSKNVGKTHYLFLDEDTLFDKENSLHYHLCHIDPTFSYFKTDKKIIQSNISEKKTKINELAKGHPDLKKKSKLWTRFIFLAVLLCIVIYLVSLRIQLNRLQNERNELAEIVDTYKTSIADMERELLLPKEEYIAKYAREVLGYYRYSDIIFKEKTK
jgi:cell division protein FtsB